MTNRFVESCVRTLNRDVSRWLDRTSSTIQGSVRWGVRPVKIVFETMIAAWLLDSTRMSYGMDALGRSISITKPSTTPMSFRTASCFPMFPSIWPPGMGRRIPT
jgi:hypothetical protein